MNLPNLISLARLLSVPLEIYLILHSQYMLAFWLFVLAGVSDAVDGWIAKGLRQTTWLGSYLDPLADKTLLVGVYVTLGYQSLLPTWIVILVVFRDLLIVGGVIMQLAFARVVEISPSLISKANTAVQILLAAAVLAQLGVAQNLATAVTVLIYLAGVTTVLSGAGYLVTWWRQMANMETPR